MIEIEQTSTLNLAIIRIEVERLFGRYSYVLSFDELNIGAIYSPFILYGDNGTGKTTIIKLLFHLLSPRKKRGHLTFIAQTSFAKFSVFLADGKHITISRQDTLLGSFKLQLSQGKDVIVDEEIKSDTSNRVRYSQGGENFYQKLSEFQLNLFFIGDNRIIESDFFESDFFADENKNSEGDLFEEEVDVISQRLRTSKEKPNTNRDVSLKKTIQRFEKWVSQRAITDTQLGTVNVNSFYEDMTEQIISAKEAVDKDSSYSSQALIEKLHHLEARSREFSAFGLMAPLNTQKLVKTLSQSDDDAQSLITWKVLKPYVDSIAVRLDALQNTKDLFVLFVEKINRFFYDKKVCLHIQSGLKITTADNAQEISPDMLSSGEKQLLLLFCNTLTARDKATIFIIDEPEISLNIKWQRQLIRTLLDFSKNSQVQFLFATHSIELLSQYRQQVVKLSNNNVVAE
jgi:ABC-type cobalamin/Fe3+-siderophores transport system ATPase subunit